MVRLCCAAQNLDLSDDSCSALTGVGGKVASGLSLRQHLHKELPGSAEAPTGSTNTLLYLNCRVPPQASVSIGLVGKGLRSR